MISMSNASKSKNGREGDGRWSSESKAVILTCVLTLGIQVGGYFVTAHDKQKEDLMLRRREALLSALRVIDHAYSNSSFDGRPPTNPHSWDLASANDAMNGMIIYCKDPKRAITAFNAALGAHNPKTQSPKSFTPEVLAEFRSIVCHELEVKAPQYADSSMIWIAQLPGTQSKASATNSTSPPSQ